MDVFCYFVVIGCLGKVFLGVKPLCRIAGTHRWCKSNYFGQHDEARPAQSPNFGRLLLEARWQFRY
jgi:hypothetical protein